jgi:hypothetical protein
LYPISIISYCPFISPSVVQYHSSTKFCFLEVCHARLLAIGVILYIELKNIRKFLFAKSVRLSVSESLHPSNLKRSLAKHQQFLWSATASRLNYFVIRLILKSLIYRCIFDVQQTLLSFILGQLFGPMRRQLKQLHFFMSDMLASKLTASSITLGFNTLVYSIYSRCATDPHLKSVCLHVSTCV